MKRFIIFLMTCMLLTSSASAETLPENPQLYSGSKTMQNGTVGYVSIEGGTNIYRSALAGRIIENNTVKSIGTCTSLTDETCSKANFLTYLSVLGPCENTSSTDCISALDAIDANGAVFPGTIGKSFLTTKDGSYSGNATRKLPAGGQSPLVDIPGAPHEFGSKYLPIVRIRGATNPDGGNFSLHELFIRLYPVKVVQGSYNFVTELIDLNPANYAGSPTISHERSGDPNCVINDLTQCAVPTELPLDKKFRLTIRTSIPLPGWMHGKVANPDISMKTVSNGYETTISANSIINPIISVQKEVNSLSADFLEPYAKALTPSSSSCDRKVIPYDLTKCTYLTLIGGYNKQDFDEFMKWLPLSGDTAFINPTIWNIIADNETKLVGGCQIEDNQLSGMVSTNASMYLSGPPSWSATEQTLDYKVAAPHLLADKTLFQGSYDLAISSKLARCIYKFSNAPINATVSITSADGTPQIATTIVREANGFLYLSAKGFTYSSPNLSIKLTGEKIQEMAQPTPSAGPTAKPVASIVKKITCVKGKSKKVLSTKSCPKGWTLKNSK